MLAAIASIDLYGARIFGGRPRFRRGASAFASKSYGAIWSRSMIGHTASAAAFNRS